MLNMFLVLGQIPGTQHQLSFSEILIIALLLLEFYLLRRYKHLFINKKLLTTVRRQNRLPIQLQLFK